MNGICKQSGADEEMRQHSNSPAPPLPYDTFGGRSLSMDFRAFENEGLRVALSKNDALRVSAMNAKTMESQEIGGSGGTSRRVGIWQKNVYKPELSQGDGVSSDWLSIGKVNTSDMLCRTRQCFSTGTTEAGGCTSW